MAHRNGLTSGECRAHHPNRRAKQRRVSFIFPAALANRAADQNAAHPIQIKEDPTCYPPKPPKTNR